MNFTFFDFSEKGIIRRLGAIAFVSAIGDILAYPFDRLKVREIARSTFTTQSLFHETKAIFNEICKAETTSGLTYGMRAAIDKGLAMNLTRFLLFDFLVGRPRESFVPISNFELYLGALGAQSMAFLLTQPSNILKLKIQCEPLGMNHTKYESYKEKQRKISQFHNGKHTIFTSAGFKSGMIASNIIAGTEILIFFKFLRYFYEETHIKSDYFKVCTSALITSIITTSLTHPLDFLNHRYAIKALQGETLPHFQQYVAQIFKDEMGIRSLYKGILPSLAKNAITTVSTFCLWNFFQTTKSRRHEALYNYYARKHENRFEAQDAPTTYEMRGGRDKVR